AALVAENVVDLLAVAVSVGDDVAHALRQRGGLVDERPLGGGEELARGLRYGRDVVLAERRMRALDPARDVPGEADHLAQVYAPRVPLVDGRHHVLAHARRVQAVVGEGLAERAEFAARLDLPLGIGHGPAVGGVEPLRQYPLELRDVGLAAAAPAESRRCSA